MLLVFDMSWVSMKSFLAKRVVREDIATFDVQNIPKEIRVLKTFFLEIKDLLIQRMLSMPVLQLLL